MSRYGSPIDDFKIINYNTLVISGLKYRKEDCIAIRSANINNPFFAKILGIFVHEYNGKQYCWVNIRWYEYVNERIPNDSCIRFPSLKFGNEDVITPDNIKCKVLIMHDFSKKNVFLVNLNVNFNK